MSLWSRLRSGGRGLLTVILCVGFLMLGGIVFGGLAALKEPPKQRDTAERIYNVEVFAVKPTDLREMISAYGTARADREVVLAAQVSGIVIDTHEELEVGQRVRGLDFLTDTSKPLVPVEGTLLVEIDPRTYDQRIRQAEAQVAQLKAEREQLTQEEKNLTRLLKQSKDDYEIYREEYERVRKSFANGSISPSQFTQTRLQFKTYEQSLITRQQELLLIPARLKTLDKRIEAAELELEVARTDLHRTEVRPPFDGILREVLVEKGQYVRPGDPLVRLTAVDHVEIPLPLTLRDYARIEQRLRSGEPVLVDLAEDEISEPLWTGEVTRVSPVADENSRTIEVFVTVDNTQQPSPLRPGTFVHALIAGPVREKIKVVPEDAIVSGRLFVARNGRAKRLDVEIERRIESMAVLPDDTPLEDGDQVILTNLDVLKPKTAVRPGRVYTLEESLANQRTERLRPLDATVAE